MKRTIAIRLVTTPEQMKNFVALRSAFSAACNLVAPIALEHRVTNRVRLHHLAYRTVRAALPALGAQLACNAVAAVARSLKAHRANRRSWISVERRAEAAVHFDARTYRLIDGTVSLFTLAGRRKIPVRLGSFQRQYLKRAVLREAELVERRGRWYLHVVLSLPEPKNVGGSGVLGVDLGENVAAATSGGTLFGGGRLRETRDRFLALRKRLQGNGSQSAKQLLIRISGQEARHVRHVNHKISAAVVRETLEGGYGTIAMENLTNIRERIRMGKRMRTRLHRWAWRQLQQFVEYKAADVGIATLYVDPAYTSQTCSLCGAMGSRSRHRFSCKICGIFAHSDRNAARNLAKIGASALVPTGDVMRPNVAA
ncbi:MAG TPA: transposase [Candidatus Baltobacteraceae bacterium]|nr:transposase [Candidatus Baltobacteraceae bacterium]